MVSPRRNILIVTAIAAALWVVPSVGTRGMGTAGQRFSHPDLGLIGASTVSGKTSDGTRQMLRAADRAVEAALPGS